MRRTTWLLVAVVAWTAAGVGRAAVETDFLERPWPRQRVRQFEVGRYDVRWREKASKQEGVFAGVRFEAAGPREAVWDLAKDYDDIGRTTPGVQAVRVLEQSETRQIIQIDIHVLWKTLTLTFEIEQEPPKVMRFRLTNEAVGEYRGVCVFEESTGTGAAGEGNVMTPVEFSTWLKPSRPVPTGLILLVERMTLLGSIKSFLETCDRQQRRR